MKHIRIRLKNQNVYMSHDFQLLWTAFTASSSNVRDILEPPVIVIFVCNYIFKNALFSHCHCMWLPRLSGATKFYIWSDLITCEKPARLRPHKISQ